ncbi:MAG: hypothetical protein UDI22_08420, partial [Faecalibacterium prausnitzii]|nr:hypothetical protein [Faecalibacterium prausnitzii]
NSWQNSKYKQRAAARFVQQPFRVRRLEMSSASLWIFSAEQTFLFGFPNACGRLGSLFRHHSTFRL